MCVVDCLHMLRVCPPISLSFDALKLTNIRMSIVKICTPTTIGVYGPTQSGKTNFVLRLLKEANQLFTKHVEEIYYCYAAYQTVYESLNEAKKNGVDNVVFYEGLPGIDQCKEWAYMKSHIVIVFDDLMTDLTKHADIVKFATVDCHHSNITMIVMLHNIFPPGLRTMSLNLHYVVLFKNKRDTLQVDTLGRRIMKERVKYFSAVYRHAVAKPYGYLLIDMHPRTDEAYQLRTHILPAEAPTTVYTPRKR